MKKKTKIVVWHWDSIGHRLPCNEVACTYPLAVNITQEKGQKERGLLLVNHDPTISSLFCSLSTPATII